MIACIECQTPYPEKGAPYLCPQCGGLFDELTQSNFLPENFHPNTQLPGIWRYSQTFGLPANSPVISLGEGNTPLIPVEAFGRHVYVKCEYQNPTGSFKDRGSAPLVSFLRFRGVTEAVEDSSGNAGASYAAYAARAGIRARVFVPEVASGPKRAQIDAYGAEVVPVPGPRSNAADAVRLAASEGTAYASHAYLPFNLPGYATIAYEIVEQLGCLPGAVLIPVGQGGLLLGAGRGFRILRIARDVDVVPRLIGVQAGACAPLWATAQLMEASSSASVPGSLQQVEEATTVAEGVRVSHPLRWQAVLQEVWASQGRFIRVDENAILPARDQLASQGFYVEPTSAIVWCALADLADSLADPIVIVLTGSGLKSG